jgi:cation diffusion facilitator CzcD-associated flavoprotein CzcO
MTPASSELTGAHDVAIIGAGFSGIAAAAALVKQGVNDFVVFERGTDVGGTWLFNRYPGAEVDLESHIYSYSFEPYDWTRTHATWDELLDYLQKTARKWGVYDRALFDTGVKLVSWSDEAQVYTIEDGHGQLYGPFKSVISGIGYLNTPLIPPFARGETLYEGEMCHTSTWRDELSFEDKHIGVLGTGSSAVQVVTEAERQGKSVKVFQIEPNWMLPKEARDFSKSERRWNRFKPVYYYRRWMLYINYDIRQYRTSIARNDGLFHKTRTRRAEAYLEREMGDCPQMKDLLTPSFSVEARRTVISDTYYQALRSPKVELIPHAVTDLTATGLIDASGEKHEFDMIVLATGFDASDFLTTFRITGERGLDIKDQWADGPEAMFGVMAPNFPNFFMIFGPNTAGIPLVSYYEAQAKFAAKTIKKIAGGRARRVTVREGFHRYYNRRTQKRLSKTVWGEVTNYFRAQNGKVIAQWAFSPTAYLVGIRIARRLGIKVEK